MSVEWFRIHIALRRHPKYLLLRAKVGPGAMEYLHGLWSWGAQARRDGKLREPTEAEIAADWRGPAGELHAALISAGFLEDDGVTLHDWEHHNGKAIAAMLRHRDVNAEQMRRARSSSPIPPSPPHTTATPTPTPTATGVGTVGDTRVRTQTGGNGVHEAATPGATPPAAPIAKKKTGMTLAQAERFATWYAVWPNKVGRGAAEKAFMALDPGEDLLGRMVMAVRQQAAWRANAPAGAFRPPWKHPATWLNQRCWEDSPAADVLPRERESSIDRLRREGAGGPF